MLYSSIDANDVRLLQPEFIDLEPEHFEQATQISDYGLSEICQWQTYLNALALLGFRQWLNEQDVHLPVNHENCSIFQPQYANTIEAVCNLAVGEFKLCLIATENWLDEVIKIPRAVVDLPDFAAHFYVVLEVQEEQGRVIIRGYGRYDQLTNLRRRMSLAANDSWHYVWPSSFFDPEPNHLLFNINFLEASAIPLPNPIATLLPTPLTQPELETILSHLQSTERSLWQILPWEKGASLLQSPELLNLLYQWQRSLEKPLSLRIRIAEVFTLLTQQAINTAQWLQGELDELAQSIGWFSSQMLTPTGFEFRSMDKFRAAIEDLRYQGMDIPSQVNPMYQDIEWDGTLLRLCAVAWTLATSTPVPQWVLLLILGTQMGSPLPDGLKLCVADLTHILCDEQSELDTQLLYARVEANQSKKLVATIVSPEGQALTLTPYSFAALPMEWSST
ncbi:MAG: DUF1822 family protein [Cyanobacteria bacterium P01_F01_bin.86]